MSPKALVEQMLDEPDLTYKTVYPIGDEDVDLTVEYTAAPAQPGDSGYRPGVYHVKITQVVRDDTGQSILDQLTRDQFYDLEEKVSEHFHHYVR